MKTRGRKGFSLAEIVVSMALIVMMSAVGFLACYAAIHISSGNDEELKGYSDAEVLRLSLDEAWQSVGKDSSQKDAFILRFVQNAEWYFLTEGLYDAVTEHSFAEDWTVEMGGGTEGRTLSFRCDGSDSFGTTYIFSLLIFDATYETQCSLNCRTGIFYVSIQSKKTNASLAFYEDAFQYRGGLG